MIREILKDKKFLMESIIPNITFNRFDVAYGDDFFLFDVHGTLMPVRIDGRNGSVGAYYRKIEANCWRDLTKYLFKRFPNLKRIKIVQALSSLEDFCGLNWHGDIARKHYHLDLPVTIEEFDSRLSANERQNKRHYRRKIIRDFGDFSVERHSQKNEKVKDAMLAFAMWKKASHNFDMPENFYENWGITDTYILYINDTMQAMRFISCLCPNEAFCMNASQNPDFNHYSLGTMLRHSVFEDLLKRGIKKFTWAGARHIKRRLARHQLRDARVIC